ncbi:hypothetical protein ACIQ9Q_14005 [Streptomyces sp. NPDC094438]|uniref:hypothetical protein n=1 Tax=Streptomyces sp. NPDC094438 TaxID=3366061 RepID=UPI0037FD1397
MMLALAREANDLGEAKLSLDEIAKLTNLTPRAITTCLGELSVLGELKYEPGGGRHNSNRYSLLLDALPGSVAAPQPPAEDQGKGGSNFQEVASGTRKFEQETRKSAPGKGEVSSSRARGVNTPYGSINTTNKQASSLPSQDSGNQRGPVSVDVPAGAQDVVAALEAAGMLVGWRLSEPEWERVTALSARWGTERLVEVIARRWDPARPPQSARYLLRIWDDLPSQVPAEAPKGNVVPLRREVAGWKPFRNPAKSSAYQNGF